MSEIAGCLKDRTGEFREDKREAGRRDSPVTASPKCTLKNVFPRASSGKICAGSQGAKGETKALGTLLGYYSHGRVRAQYKSLVGAPLTAVAGIPMGGTVFSVEL